LVKNAISLNLIKGFASADFGTLDKVTQRGATIVPTGTAKNKNNPFPFGLSIIPL
jgi:hypothetical protein